MNEEIVNSNVNSNVIQTGDFNAETLTSANDKSTGRDKGIVRFLYIRNKDKHPVGCLAYRMNWSLQAIEWQISSHNPLDAFDRTRCRKTAEVRLSRNPLVYYYDKTLISLREILEELEDYIVKSGGKVFYKEGKAIPTRIRKNLKRKLQKFSPFKTNENSFLFDAERKY